ncbi:MULTISPECIES: glycoside hydrolase family 127 protein [unclassified Mesorhizobium]|uniref:glycoside hydrolase family 127 protein n=1 Tax=unclassified Mesorhizobium TaxID=325217 RepID=UPI001128ADF8|nr:MULTISPECIES: glycoside hydrolase family 127 protein [unclassified Mesorhizobium]MBZ9696407.1 glycoside hydrolase family 127 protein [Mesorhizobium sp. CO1-1-9]TPK11575.1 glycoside hydrolase family 127 protein [Mesorhizobium sp. B2-5-7]
MTASPSPRHATPNKSQETGKPKLAFRPLPVPQVDVRGFWGDRAEAVATRTADILYDRCVAARMLEQIDPDRPSPGVVIPFHSPSPDEAASAGFTGSTVTTQMFWDSDLGKTIETAAYSLYRRKNPELEKKIDAVIDMYGRLQQEDGYLSSWYQRIQPGKRWTNLRDCHELYCAGHLIEGAVAYYQATGKRKLLDIMCRYADHIASVLGPEPGKKKGYCGHEEIELALVKLARVTGEQKYMELAKYFIDQRGQQPHYFDEEARARGADPKAYHFKTYEYSQSHIPVREQDKVVGHAVRAMYLYSGMADIATEYGDDTLRVALDRLWDDLTTKNLYITGGLGPSAHNEGFTSDYDLPNETAYAETCASVGLVFWASRMLGMGPNARYADMMERALYNGSISGLSLDGSLFFYENPLESRGKHNRWKWHRCPCCPPNIGRMVASIGSYFYSLADDALAVHLYGDSTARFDIAGTPVTLTQASRYPWDGAVEITVEPQAPVEFTLHLRVPAWSSKAKLDINGEAIDLAEVTSNGYAAIRRQWKKGDRVRLDLEMPIERLYANPEVRQDAGRVALSRGPLIYCVEATDNDSRLHRLTLPRTAGIEAHDEPDLLGGVVTLSATAQADAGDGWQDGLYRSEPPARVETRLTAVPYFAWDNREPGEMLVWLRDG